jgi:MYXO-CTERM domain-containing protein
MLATFMGGVTIDGLYLSGSQSDTGMGSLGDGICVMLGRDSSLLNSEITLCDIGIMTAGENVVVRNNYVHDLFISVDGDLGIDPNAVGGAEGIFVNSSNVEVAYNRFINCTIPARWVSKTSTRCDGGATEVTVGYAGEVTNVRIHHNLSYNSCGFFEVSSMFQSEEDKAAGLPYEKGKFTNSVFHNNVMIDSGWISLLQINNTKLLNVRWENNTIVHHDLGTDENGVDLNDFASSYIQAIAFNDTSSGATGGGEISEGDIYWTNNLWYFDPGLKYLSPVDTDELLKNIVQQNNVVLRSDPGFINLAGTTNPSDFDRVMIEGSPVIDQGKPLAEITSDFLERPAPVGTLDIGAFEYQGPQGGSVGVGGADGVGGVVDIGGADGVGGAVGEGEVGGAGSPSIEGGSQGVDAPTNSTAGTASENAAKGPDDGGCGCRMAGTSSKSVVGIGFLMLGAALLRRPRRRRA